MYTLFTEQIHPFHIEVAHDLLHISSKESWELCYSEELQQKLERYQSIVQKFQVLSQEYQNQAKQFQQKHIEISA